MRREALYWLLAVLLAWGAADISHAGVLYDAETNTIKVTDFPAELPCNLSRLLSVDGMYEWGKVTYDKASDTYTVAADLWIGANDGTETYFIVGSKDHPKETLVMKGNLVVYPYFVTGENEGDWYKAPKKVNRLTLGDPSDKSITATLKFDCETKAQYGLHVGGFPNAEKKLTRGAGGQLHVHNSTITAATQDAAHAFGSPYFGGHNYLGGNSMIFDDATYSWVAGFMCYGLMENNGVVANTTFESGGSVLINGRQNPVGCTFRNCGTAILDYGGLDAVATDCTFTGNQANWSLTYSDKGLTCIDCTYDAPVKANPHRAWVEPKSKKKQYPTFVDKHRVIVEVVDAKGKPVSGAKVGVTCEQELAEWEETILDMLENGTRTTSAAGKTPGEGEERPIILTKLTMRATDAPDKPVSKEYTYVINASIEGGAGATVKGFKPSKRFEVVRITLKR